MSFRHKGLVAAMEDDQDTGGGPVEMVPETTAQVEADSAELTEDSNELEDVVVAAEEAEADAAALGDIAGVMEESVQEGEGLDETAAQITEVAVESICARLGVRRYSRTIPSMESFGSRSSRVSATRIAMEGIGDIIKKIWDAIVSAAKRVWEFIRGIAGKITKSRDSLLKHLEDLEEKVVKLSSGAKMKEKKISGGFAKVFTFEKKSNLDTATKILVCSGGAIPSAKKMVAEYSKLSQIFIGRVDEISKDANGADSVKSTPALIATFDTLKSVVIGYASGLGSSTAEAVAKLKEKNKLKGEVGVHGAFPNGKSFFYEISNRGERAKTEKAAALTDAEKSENLTIKLGFMENSKEEADEADALDKAGMQKLLEAAITTVKQLKEYDKIKSDIESTVKTVITAADKVLKAASSVAREGEDKGKARRLNELASISREVVSALSQTGAQLPTMAYNAAKSAGDYVSASIRNLESGDKKKD